MRSLGVELTRMWRRRAVVLLTVLGLVGILVILGFVVSNAVPPSAAARAAAQAKVDQQLADPEFQRQLRACEQAQGEGESGASGSAVAAPSGEAVPLPPDGVTCQEALAPKVEWYLNWAPPDYVSGLKSNLQAVTMVLALALALAGITFAGADWSAGTMATQLLYDPRRIRVFTAKAGAMAIVGLIVGAVAVGIAWAVSYLVAARWGTVEMLQPLTPTPGPLGAQGALSGPIPVSGAELLGWVVRAATIVGGAAVGGFLLAMLLRSSLAAAAVLVGYGLVGEGVLRGLLPGIEPYLVSSRLLAWLSGPYPVVRYPRVCGGPGHPCEPTVSLISVSAGGIYLAVLLAVGLALAGATFARRDVG